MPNNDGNYSNALMVAAGVLAIAAMIVANVLAGK